MLLHPAEQLQELKKRLGEEFSDISTTVSEKDFEISTSTSGFEWTTMTQTYEIFVGQK